MSNYSHNISQCGVSNNGCIRKHNSAPCHKVSAKFQMMPQLAPDASDQFLSGSYR